MDIIKLDTNEDIIEKERQTLTEWNNTYGVQVGHYVEIINNYLEKYQYDKLIQLFNDELFLSNYCKEPDIAYMQIVMSIYQEELNRGVRNTIISNKTNMYDVIDFYNLTKFIVWRIEWDLDNCFDDFYEHINNYIVSDVMIQYIIHTSSTHKVETLFKIAWLFRKKNLDSRALTLLKYANELQPKDEYILGQIKEILINAGREDALEKLI